MNDNPRNSMAMWIRYSPVVLLMWYVIYLFAYAICAWACNWRASR